MKFTNLMTTEFGNYTDKMPYSHFTQMTENYEMKVANKTETHLVGIKIKIMRLLRLHVDKVPVMKFLSTFILTEDL